MLMLSHDAWARELYGPDAGVVPFGMGRAYSAIADDALSLHYNPAGLALVKTVEFQLFDLRLSSNRDVVQGYSNFKELGKSSQNSVADSLSGLSGKHLMVQAGNTTQLTLPGIAVAAIYNVHTDFDMQNQAYPTTQMRYTKDLGFKLGGGYGFGKRKDLRIGASVKWMKRIGGVRNISFTELSGSRNSIIERFSESGSGYGGDFGTQYRLPIPGRTEITTSFMWHDIGNTTFGGKQAKNPPTQVDQNIVLGLGIRFPIGGKKNRRLERRYGPSRSSSHLSFAFDYSHLNYSWSKEHLPKHTHVGMNLDLPIMSFQVGLNQTSITFGTSFDIDIIRVALATYGEEIGSYGGQRVDRRYLLSIGTGFGFGGF